MSPELKTSLLLDTDIGDDVDDILALAFALAHPELELLGITTVFRNTQARAQMAKYLLRLAGRENIPVHAGVGQPLKNALDVVQTPHLFGSEMEGIEIDTLGAVEFLCSVLEKQRAHLVCIGPLTNIATLIEKRPDVLTNVDSLIMMGGSYYRHANEWNIVCDPEAAHIVFNSGLNINAFGLDVTAPCEIDPGKMEKAGDHNPMQEYLLEMCRRWKTHSGFSPILHDPLTIYSMLKRSDIHYQSEMIHIELQGEHTRGMTVCEDHRIWGRVAPAPNIQVAADFDRPRFIEYFLATVFGD